MLQDEGKLLAGVRDFGIPCGHPGLQTLGWPADHELHPRYFNAGVLLLHMPSLQAALPRIQELLKACCSEAGNEQVLKYADQDVLNVICMEMGGYLELEPKWNVQVCHSSNKLQILEGYSCFRASGSFFTLRSGTLPC